MTLAEEAADLFQKHRKELGFVNVAQCREKDLYTVKKDSSVVGAVLCNHCVRKPQTTIYDIAVYDEYRGEGHGTELVDKVWKDSPHEKIVAKCPIDLPSNHFYRESGWELVDVESGKNRELCVWQYYG